MNLSATEMEFQRRGAFVGVELVPQTRKLALMNTMLHGIQGPIIQGDALGDAGESLGLADLIMTNPPFGTKRGAGLPTRPFPIPTSNKQLAFLQHIYLGLTPGGRAAVVMPDLQGSTAPRICEDLMEKCRLHTVLRLPMGIFYAPGVRTNVLFFTRGATDSGNTKDVWIYDLRSDIPRFGKRTPIERSHFTQFERAFGPDPNGMSNRRNHVDEVRFRSFTRDYIRERGNNLFFIWDGSDETREGRIAPDPEILANSIEDKIKLIFKELSALREDLSSRN
jgi:type I restriction enzyme M protein